MRYRIVDVRIWGDQKFQLLSPLRPSGQALFLYLLTNPNTTSIPGLYRAGAAAMAEELGWSLVCFNRALKEVTDQGLVKLDRQARVIFIANAIYYNKPQSPNVIRSWALHWDEIPECPLKQAAYQSLKSFIQGLGKGFLEAFEEALGKAYSRKEGKPCLNQEQEQEQEPDQKQKQEEGQEQDDDGGAPSLNDGLPSSSNSELKNSPVKQLFDVIDNKVVSIATTVTSAGLYQIPLSDGSQFVVLPTSITHWQKTYPAVDVVQELRQIQAWNEANPTERKSRTQILRHINSWLAKEQRAASQQRKQSPPFDPRFDLARRGLSPTLAHNLIVGEQWLKQSMAKEETLHPLSDAQEILC